jgi:uncharacterized membrane protein
MTATRVVVWVLGLALVVAAVFLLFFETGLHRFVPIGIALAGLLLIIGVAIMGAADRFRGTRVEDRPVTRERIEEHHH